MKDYEVKHLVEDVMRKNKKHKEESENNFKERVNETAKRVLDFAQRKLDGGYTKEQIEKELDRSKYFKG